MTRPSMPRKNITPRCFPVFYFHFSWYFCLVFTGRANHRSLDYDRWHEHRCDASRWGGCARSHSYVTWCPTEGQYPASSFDWHSDLGNCGSQKNSRRQSGGFLANNSAKQYSKVFGSMSLSEQLCSYPSPNPAKVKWHQARVIVGLGEG